jgi:hypothetical protein
MTAVRLATRNDEPHCGSERSYAQAPYHWLLQLAAPSGAAATSLTRPYTPIRRI